MRVLIEPRDRIYVKVYGFLSFAKNMGKKLSNKCSQKLLDSAKKSTTQVIKTTSKWAVQKTALVAGELIGNKMADKTTSVSKSPKEFHSKEFHEKQMRMKQIYQKKDVYLQKKDNSLLMN